MRIIFKDGQILDLNSVEKVIIEPTDGDTLSDIKFLEHSLEAFKVCKGNGRIRNIRKEDIDD